MLSTQKSVNQRVLMKGFPLIMWDLQNYHMLKSFRLAELSSQS